MRALGQPEHVDGAMHAGLGGLHRVVLVMHGRGRAGQIEDAVDFHIKRKGNVVPHQFEVGVIEQVRNVLLAAGKEVVDAQHVMAIAQQPVAQVRAKKACTTGYQHLVHRQTPEPPMHVGVL
jgi:hypothetical protein